MILTPTLTIIINLFIYVYVKHKSALNIIKTKQQQLLILPPPPLLLIILLIIIHYQQFHYHNHYYYCCCLWNARREPSNTSTMDGANCTVHEGRGEAPWRHNWGSVSGSVSGNLYDDVRKRWESTPINHVHVCHTFWSVSFMLLKEGLFLYSVVGFNSPPNHTLKANKQKDYLHDT